MPTETVYGLAADARSDKAVAAIFAAKGRPRFNPLIVHLPSLAAAERIAVMSGDARRLAEAFWPGPLTIVLVRRADSGISDLATAGLDTVAIRVPAHPVAQALLKATGMPLAAPSANRSGHVSPTTAVHVAADLGEAVAVILDAGPTGIGLESTVIGFDDDRAVLLRPGGLPRAEIEKRARRLAPCPRRKSGAAVLARYAGAALRSRRAPPARRRRSPRRRGADRLRPHACRPAPDRRRPSATSVRPATSPKRRRISSRHSASLTKRPTGSR